MDLAGVDVTRIAEGLFIAGMVYGVVKTELRQIRARMDAADDAREHLTRRIDEIFVLLTRKGT